VTAISYEPGGRKPGIQDTDLGAWSYGYDALGNLASKAEVSYTYDYDDLLTAGVVVYFTASGPEAFAEGLAPVCEGFKK